MRLGMGLVHRGVGDFVAGCFTVPQTPVGLGDFVPGRYTLPQTPPFMGMSGLGAGCACGSGCDCGPCRSSGMGAIDWSLTSTGIASSVGITSVAIPNWAIYGLGAAALFFGMGGHKKFRH